TATSQADGSTSAAVTDTTTVSLVPGVALSAGHGDSAVPGQAVTYTHTLTNTGNGPDTFAVTCTHDLGWDTQCAPASVDVAREATATVRVTVTPPADAVSGTVGTVTITATSQADGSTSAAVTDTTTVSQVPGVALAPDRSGTSDPGQAVTYTHTLTNTGNGPDTFDLTQQAPSGWTVTVAPNPVTLGPRAAQTISVTVMPPADAISDTVGTVVVTATSQADGSTSAAVTDTTTVSLVPGVALSASHGDSAVPGQAVTYTHTLTNTGNGPDTFDLTQQAPSGWTVQVVPNPVTLGPRAAQTISVTVTPPSDAISGTVGTVTITATSQADGAVFATVRDTLTVTGAVHRIYLPVVLRGR
ncbi:MAG TPA: hypothetical protein ENK17_07100, partial [Anaerolineae bacterium]|nr:hypothetical protein [Anaerolineae bacterium]